MTGGKSRRGGRGKGQGRGGDSSGGRGNNRSIQQAVSNEVPRSSLPVTPLTRDYFEKRLEQAKKDIAFWRASADEKQAALDQVYLDFDQEYKKLQTQPSASSDKENETTENLIKRLEEIKVREELALARQTIAKQGNELKQIRDEYSMVKS